MLAQQHPCQSRIALVCVSADPSIPSCIRLPLEVPFTIGYHSGCDVVLPVSQARVPARHHGVQPQDDHRASAPPSHLTMVVKVELRRDAIVPVVEATGVDVWINGVRLPQATTQSEEMVTRHTLRCGDVVSIGSCEWGASAAFRVSLLDSPAVEHASPPRGSAEAPAPGGPTEGLRFPRAGAFAAVSPTHAKVGIGSLRPLSPTRLSRPLVARHVDVFQTMKPAAVSECAAVVCIPAAEYERLRFTVPTPLCPHGSVEELLPSLGAQDNAVSTNTELTAPESSHLGYYLSPEYLCLHDGGIRAYLPLVDSSKHRRVSKEQLVTARGMKAVGRAFGRVALPLDDVTPSSADRALSFLESLRNRFQRMTTASGSFGPLEEHRQHLRQHCAAILTAAAAQLSHEPYVLHLDGPVWCCGDLHGSFADLSLVVDEVLPFGQVRFHKCGSVLFLGDYVDRGEWSVEVALFLLSWKVAQPQRVWLLRGNHEDPAVNGDTEQYGDTSFRAKCIVAFGPDDGLRMWTAFNAAFSALPVAAVIDGRVFACHGGVPHFAAVGACLQHGEASLRRRRAQSGVKGSDDADLRGQDDAVVEVDEMAAFDAGLDLFREIVRPPQKAKPCIDADERATSGAKQATPPKCSFHSLMPGNDECGAVDSNGVSFHEGRHAHGNRRGAILRLLREIVWNDPCDSAATPLAERMTTTTSPSSPSDAPVGNPVDAFGFRCNEGRGDHEGVIHEFSQEAVERFLDFLGCSLIVRAHQHKRNGVEIANSRSVITIFSSCNYSEANAAGACLLHQGAVHVVSWNRPCMSPPRSHADGSSGALGVDSGLTAVKLTWSCGLLPSFRSLQGPPAVTPPLLQVAARATCENEHPANSPKVLLSAACQASATPPAARRETVIREPPSPARVHGEKPAAASCALTDAAGDGSRTSTPTRGRSSRIFG